jgi:AAA family ATP:ADP antiporter
MGKAPPMKARIRSFLRKLAPLRAGEEKIVGYLFAHFFFLMAAIYVSKVSKTSLFLGLGLTKGSLPLVYFVSAVLTGVFAAWNTKKIRSLDRGAFLSLTRWFFALGTSVFFALFWLTRNVPPGRSVVPALYWFWLEIFVLASVTQFWVVVGSVCPPRRAKHLVSFFVSGGLLGGICGAVLVVFLSRLMPTRNLILLGLAFYLVGTVFVRAAIRQAPAAPAAGPGAPPDFRDGFRAVAGSPYLRLLGALIVVTLAASTMIDFQFNMEVSRVFAGDEGRRTSFLAVFFIAVLVVSWLLNSLLANRAIRTLGVRAALFVMPIFLAAGSAAFLVIPAAAFASWAIFMKGADKSLTHTFSQATRELLYIPVPQDVKAKAKMTIDMFISKTGEALASLLQVIFGVVLALPVARMSLVTIAVVVVWLLILVRIGRQYLPAIRENLVPSRPDAERFVREQARPETAKQLLDLLESRERSSVLYAYNLFDLLRAEKLTPELRQVLSDKSAEVRASALDTLLDADSEALGPDWSDASDKEPIDVTVREVLALDDYQNIMRPSFDAIAGAADREVDQMEVAKALGMMPADAPLTENLARLLQHESPGVVQYALESAGRLRKREYLPYIVPHLGRPSVSDRASEALAAYGDKAVPILRDWMADFRADRTIRRALPAVLAEIGTSRAVDALVRQLRRRDPEVTEGVIEALFKLRTRCEDVKFRERDIMPEIRCWVEGACRKAEVWSVTGRENAESGGGATDPDFRPLFLLLGLLYAHKDISQALQNYTEGTKRAVDYALELLENVLPKAVTDMVLPLLEDAPRAEKARTARRILKSLK